MDVRKLVELASNHIKSHYVKGKHHVAVALYANNKVYLSVHLDTKGFDICAEPIAIHNALSDGSDFKQIVAVMKMDSKYEVISPCGNCRQLLLDFAPQVQVVIRNDKKNLTLKPIELLPYPY